MSENRRSTPEGVYTQSSFKDDKEFFNDELFKSLQKGEATARNSFYRRVSERAHGYFTRHIYSPEDAEDLAQRALLKILEKLPTFTFQGELRFLKFMYKIFFNLHSNYYRDTAVRTIVRIDQERFDLPSNHPEEQNPEQIVIDKQVAHQKRLFLTLGLRKVHPVQRKALRLHYLKGLTNKEVGVILNTTEGAIKSKLFRALQRIREVNSLN